MKNFVLILIFIFIIGCTQKPQLPNMGASLNDSNLINSEQTYDTYTVFFFGRILDISQIEDNRIKSLKKSFDIFSSGIGSKNIGIWTGFSDNKLDYQVGRLLCDKYNLSYNSGPYMIVSKHNPLKNGNIEDDIIINFDGIDPEKIKNIINEIEQDIRQKNYNQYVVYEQYKQFLLSQYNDNKKEINEIIKAILQLKSKK